MSTPKQVFYLIFMISGFAGLIYESIWSHYLKLFLGHAAYAQTLVLAIFMGGMAIGAAISARYSPGWKNLLLGYALVEGIIGIFALVFHKTFVNTTNLTFDTLIPFFNDSPLMILTTKWGLGTLLILPQSILLGMTFPLMVAGILRRYPKSEGHSISTLYFANSLGAVFGVLVSSFFLINYIGLPGTILTAGILNILLALIVWALTKSVTFYTPLSTPPSVANTTTSSDTTSSGLLLIVALLTGLSSFMYEIGWIRMLSLVMGSSTHSFELMLAAFILGIALGGLWLRKRIDQLDDPKRFLGYVQIAMGLMAILSIWLYHYSFDAMQFFMESIQRQESSYPVFLFISAIIALFIMLPATFCAGMTLPLATKLMTQSNYGERGIGAIYAANTLGAIIGIFISVHLLMPMLGLKVLISIGAAIDVLLGLTLLGFFLKRNPLLLPKQVLITGVTSILLFATAVLVFEMDKKRLSSGVYRHGVSSLSSDILYYKDGKTSSVSVSKLNNVITISNNGKPDASINLDRETPSPDDYTQVLLGILPLLHHPDARKAAVIGLGSGVTPDSILASEKIEQVDSIEIEPAVVEGSKLFRDRVKRTHSDPRSQIYIDDAKTFFSTRNYKYDIIVSEPPNPWVSGVSSLFTQEFYHRIKDHMNDDAVFVQWLHLYAIDTSLIATVFNALGSEFSDYMVYTSHNNLDIIIVASKKGRIPPASETIFHNKSIAGQLGVFDIKTVEDIQLLQVVNKSALAPLFNRLQTGVNSDYFPILDNNAAKARFSRSNALDILSLRSYLVPLLDKPSVRARVNSDNLTETVRSTLTKNIYNARMLYEKFVDPEFLDTNLDNKSDIRWQDILVLKSLLGNCSENHSGLIINKLYGLASATLPYLSKDKLLKLWHIISESTCINQQPVHAPTSDFVSLYLSIITNDYNNIVNFSERLLGSNTEFNSEIIEFLIISAMHGNSNIPGKTNTQMWNQWKDNRDIKKTFLTQFMLNRG